MRELSKTDDLLSMSATGLARAIRDKQVSSGEVTEAYLHRIESTNPMLNAVVQVTADVARKQAREADAAQTRGELKGQLHGVPFTVKDSFDVAGVISAGGTQGRAAYIPKEDAPAVARLRAAGAILLGKTNVPELCCTGETDNIVYGCTSNPYGLEYSPGGSSGGEAAAIAAGGSPLGIGSDALGSIRLPAHCCGIAGIKPTQGRISRAGHFPPNTLGLFGMLVQPGPLARCVEDLHLGLSNLVGFDWFDPMTVPTPLGNPDDVEVGSLRVAFFTDNGIVSPTAETVAALEAAAKSLESTGAAVEEALPTAIAETMEIGIAIVFGDGGVGMRQLLEMAGTSKVSPILQNILDNAPAKLSAEELYEMLMRWDVFRTNMHSFFKDYDLILSPVSNGPAIHHGDTQDPDWFASLSYTMIYNLTGWPAAVVRAGTSPEGFPIGVQVAAQPWRDDVALAAAKVLETDLGGWQAPDLAI